MTNLNKTLGRLRNELTAVKTAHERGLGAVDFFSKTASGSGTFDTYGVAELTITATVASGELTPAFCQPQITMNVLNYSLTSFSQNGLTLVWKYYAYGTAGASVSCSAKVVSCSKLSALTVGIA